MDAEFVLTPSQHSSPCLILLRDQGAFGCCSEIPLCTGKLSPDLPSMLPPSLPPPQPSLASVPPWDSLSETMSVPGAELSRGPDVRMRSPKSARVRAEDRFALEPFHG